MLRLRAQAMVETGHFKALHKCLTAALEDAGELYASDVKRELQRAELCYLTTTIPQEDTDDGAQAAA